MNFSPETYTTDDDQSKGELIVAKLTEMNGEDLRTFDWSTIADKRDTAIFAAWQGWTAYWPDCDIAAGYDFKMLLRDEDWQGSFAYRFRANLRPAIAFDPPRLKPAFNDELNDLADYVITCRKVGGKERRYLHGRNLTDANKDGWVIAKLIRGA